MPDLWYPATCVRGHRHQESVGPQCHLTESDQCCDLQAQEHTRLCHTRDLSEHDVVLRIMRKDNYLIGMLNKGCLALNVPLPGMRKQYGPSSVARQAGRVCHKPEHVSNPSCLSCACQYSGREPAMSIGN